MMRGCSFLRFSSNAPLPVVFPKDPRAAIDAHRERLLKMSREISGSLEKALVEVEYFPGIEEELVSAVEEVLRSSVHRTGFLEVRGERGLSASRPDGSVELTILNAALHERTYPAVIRGFEELFGPRPALEEVVEEAKRRVESLARSLKEGEAAYQLIVYDAYTDSFVEYRAVTGACADEASREVKAELFIVTPLTAVLREAKVPDTIRELARSYARELEEHIDAAVRAKEAVELGEIGGTLAVPSGLIAVNPYVGAYMQMSLAKREGVNPTEKALVWSVGVPTVLLGLPGASHPETVVSVQLREISISGAFDAYTIILSSGTTEKAGRIEANVGTQLILTLSIPALH